MRKITLACVFSLSAYAAYAATEIDRGQYGIMVEAGNTRSVKALLDAGLPPDFIADRIGSGLMIAAWEGNIEMMELFAARGARLDIVNKNGEQALQLAAFKGHTEAVKWLLAHGAPVNRGDKQWSALHYAVFNGHREVAQLLLAKGADVNARVPNEASALMLAAREGHENIAADLVKSGADPRMKNDVGDTALTWAMRYNHYDIGKLVSSPEAFANAARIPPGERGPQTRSAAAPEAINKLLQQIRIAEANGRPAVALRKQLANEVGRLRNQQRKEEAAKKLVERPSGLVITAKRKGSGEERAELVYGKRTVAAAQTEKGSEKESPAVATILARMRVAKQNGEPTDDLRKQLFEAVGYGKK